MEAIVAQSEAHAICGVVLGAVALLIIIVVAVGEMVVGVRRRDRQRRGWRW